MEQMKTVCRNPWCKGTFFYKEVDMVPVITDKRTSKIDNLLEEEVKKVPPSICPKCKSFDTELSGGVEWKTKEYEGSRFDGMPHQLKYKVTNYKL
jgi:Zn finger protein HypA/HybF involved in hydrogenase expression